MNCNLAKEITASQLRSDLPDFVTGDTVKVSVRIIEGDKSRIQVFEGVVIAIRGSGVSKTFVVRKVSDGVGVERNFPYNSPLVASVQILKHGKVRRKKIYYLRKRAGKAARLTQTYDK
jgi:large subunit ribosomal protein L19